jgi:hypothetical protein
MKKTQALIIAAILFILPGFEIGRWIYLAENSEKFSVARARYFAPYPRALQDNNISTMIFFVCLTIAAIIFLYNWRRGLLFRALGFASGLLACWMLFALM